MVCGVSAAVFRCLITYDSPEAYAMFSLYLSWSCVILELLAGLMLAYSVLKIRSELKKMPHLQANQSTFFIHLFLGLSHITVLGVGLYFIYRAFYNPSELNLKL